MIFVCGKVQPHDYTARPHRLPLPVNTPPTPIGSNRPRPSGKPPKLTDAQIGTLFEQGSLQAAERRSPPYAAKRNGMHVLRKRALRDPAVLLTTLQDYVRSRALPLWRSTRTLGDTETQQQQNIVGCAAALKLQHSYFGDRLTKPRVESRLVGQVGEYVVSTWLRGMLERFRNDPDFDVSMPEWGTCDTTIPLWDDYIVRPHPPTNFVLTKETKDSFTSIGEMDAMVCVGNDTLYVLDVSSSMASIQEKLRRLRDNPAAPFLTFRNRMRTLFGLSNGQQGFHTISKMHILCGNRYARPVCYHPQEFGSRNVHLMELPARDIIHSIAQSTFRQMLDRGILVPGNDGEFQLRHPKSQTKPMIS